MTLGKSIGSSLRLPAIRSIQSTRTTHPITHTGNSSYLKATPVNKQEPITRSTSAFHPQSSSLSIISLIILSQSSHRHWSGGYGGVYGVSFPQPPQGTKSPGSIFIFSVRLLLGSISSPWLKTFLSDVHPALMNQGYSRCVVRSSDTCGPAPQRRYCCRNLF